MAIEIRSITDAEFADFFGVDARLWGYAVEDEITDAFRSIFEVPRVLCAFDGSRMVGSSVSLALELTVPGAAQVSMCGLTWVGVLPTHRRRGVMRGMMMGHLERLRDSDVAVAGLGASESGIYRRFGFGPASRVAHVEIDPRRSAFRGPFDDGGHLVELGATAGRDAVQDLLERVRRARNGAIDRVPAGTAYALRESDKSKEGFGPTIFIGHGNASAALDGVVAYRVRSNESSEGFNTQDIRIADLYALDDTAAAGLWRHCLDRDLAARVVADRVPVDETVALRLADPRRWRAIVRDDLHLRPVDVVRLLTARRYSRDDALVIEVTDEVLPWVAGRYRVEGGLDGARCDRTGSAADLVLDAACLGSIYLGDVAVEALQRSGEVEERTPGAVRRATAMFTWSPLPWLTYMF